MVFLRLVGHPSNGGGEGGVDKSREASFDVVGGMASDQELDRVVCIFFSLSS